MLETCVASNTTEINHFTQAIYINYYFIKTYLSKEAI